MLGRRDTRDAFRKLREATDLDRDGEVQRLEAELKRAREQLRMHDQDKAGWKAEVERLERELEQAREEARRRIAEKLREVRDEAEAIGGERADDRTMKRKAEKVGDGAAGLADKVEGDEDTPGISREDRLKGYGEILDDLIDLEEEEHDEIEEALKKRQTALESASETLIKAYKAWLKRASQLANNINDPTARARAQALIKELTSATTAGVDVSGDASPSNIDDLAEELQGLIDEHVADRHINEQDRDAQEELDEAREKLRETRDEVDEVLEELDGLEPFRDEIGAWLESLGDDEEWNEVRKLLRKKLKQLDRVLGDSRRDRAARLRRYWEEVNLPGGFPVTPGPHRGRGVLIGAIAAGVGIGLLVGQVFGDGGSVQSPVEEINIAVATATNTPRSTVTATADEQVQIDTGDDTPIIVATTDSHVDYTFSSDVQRRYAPVARETSARELAEPQSMELATPTATDDTIGSTQGEAEAVETPSTTSEDHVDGADRDEVAPVIAEEDVVSEEPATDPAATEPDEAVTTIDAGAAISGDVAGADLVIEEPADTVDAEAPENAESITTISDCVQCSDDGADASLITVLPPEGPSTD